MNPNNPQQPSLPSRRRSFPSTTEDLHRAIPPPSQGHDNMLEMASQSAVPRRSDRIRQQTTTSEDGSSSEPESPATSSTTLLRRPNRNARHGVQTENEESRFVLQWVRDNYQYEADHNVPRSGMYEHYRSTCDRCHVSPVNSATFGKLIRHVLPEISTRRLGTRGQSKYHYCGIRRRTAPPPVSPGEGSSTQQSYFQQPLPSQHTGSVVPSRRTRAGGPTRFPDNSPSSVESSSRQPMMGHASPPRSFSPVDDEFDNFPGARRMQKRPRLMEQTSNYNISHVDVRLPPFAAFPFTSHGSQNDTILEFARLYEQHCNEILTLIRNGQFGSIYGRMITFHQMLPDHFRTLIDENVQVMEAIWRYDCSLYDAIIANSLPAVNAPIPSETMRGLREYTRGLETYIHQSLDGYPDFLRERKGEAAHIFVSKFRRNLKLNQMAQTASALLRPPNSVDAMIKDWEEIDYNNILDQSYWTCDCDINEIRRILVDNVGNLLRNAMTLDHWISWMEGIVERYMTAHMGHERGYYLFYAKQFVLKWSFYTDLLLRDMTLRSTATIDQFRILGLFFDELMLFLVESRIAKMLSSPAQQPPQQRLLLEVSAASACSLETPPSSSASRRSNQNNQAQQQQQSQPSSQ
ncbi:RFX DNA-binding domain-containing protein [Fennellomyces sp. T-0311]|nr:RFX DNA-binding domain-containing protein [Fennellomyces sp. T-0311]